MKQQQHIPEDLRAAALYRRDLAQIEDLGMLTEEEQEALVARARQGDAEARNEVITRLLPRVARSAARYASTWQEGQVSYLDQVQVGSEAMLTALDAALEQAPNVFASLTATAYRKMQRYARRFRTLITTPETEGAVPLAVASLDTPRCPDGEQTWADRLASVPQGHEAPPSSGAGPLDEAIGRLPKRLRSALVQSFSLFPGDPAWEAERSYPINDLASDRSEALDALYASAAAHYPQLSTGNVRATPPRQSWWKHEAPPLTEAQRRRLSQAHAHLLAHGEPLTHGKLCKVAQMGGRPVSRYLSEIKEPVASREARLSEAYARLEACGDSVGVKRLAKEAKVSGAAARGYLQSKGPMGSRKAVQA